MGTVVLLKATSVHEAVQAFEAHLRYRRRAPLTILQYRPVLRDFAEWAGERGPGSIASHELQAFVGAWIEAFEARNGREPSGYAVKGVIVALRSFYKYLERFGMLLDGEGRATSNPTLALDVPSIPQKVNDWLRQAEDETLLATPMSENEQAIVWLLRWSGLRIGEALSLRVSDVDFADGTIYVRKSKTARGIRGVPIAPELRPKLNGWLHVLRERGLLMDGGPLFPTRNRKPWTPQQAEKVVRRVGQRAGLRIDDGGISRLTPHTLRRTFGSHLLNCGVRLEVVSALLGHSSTEITERAYAELQRQTIRREMLAALGA
jgi:integrase